MSWGLQGRSRMQANGNCNAISSVSHEVALTISSQKTEQLPHSCNSPDTHLPLSGAGCCRRGLCLPLRPSWLLFQPSKWVN